MKTVKWNSKEDYSGPSEFPKYVQELIDDGYIIICITPLEYYGENFARIITALLIVNKI